MFVAKLEYCPCSYAVVTDLVLGVNLAGLCCISPVSSDVFGWLLNFGTACSGGLAFKNGSCFPLCRAFFGAVSSCFPPYHPFVCG